MAKCYINLREGVVTIWVDPGGNNLFQGFVCEFPVLEEAETSQRSVELSPTLKGAKDDPTPAGAMDEYLMEMQALRRELDGLKHEKWMAQLIIETQKRNLKARKVFYRKYKAILPERRQLRKEIKQLRKQIAEEGIDYGHK